MGITKVKVCVFLLSHNFGKTLMKIVGLQVDYFYACIYIYDYGHHSCKDSVGCLAQSSLLKSY